MNILGRWSVTSFINFVVQLAWAGVLVILGLHILVMVLQFFGLSFVLIDLPIQISAEVLPEKLSMKTSESLIIFADSMQTSYHPALFENGGRWAIAVITLIQAAGLGILLYGLSQLKAILRNLMIEKPFASDNEKRLRIIAILVMLITPLLYGYQWLSHWFFTSYVDVPQNLQTLSPTFDVSYVVIGLVILILAEIFRQATQIHQGQKLTV
jgi:hypothetical protein